MAPKKLREGFTTGSAAAAAAKAALLFLASKTAPSVEIPLPVGSRLRVPVHSIVMMEPGGARATVIKDAGDDPDVTHKAVIGATVFLESHGEGITVVGGKGVGRVTRPGLPVPVGESAINPAPMVQIKDALLEGMAEAGFTGAVRAVIDVENGEEIAKKTLNPRLGIVGGISILGTRGTVKPFSHDSYRETIRLSMNVAKEAGAEIVGLSTGGRSEGLLRRHHPDLPEVSFIQVADFFSFSLKEAAKRGFREILYACFFGKLVKMAQGHEYTHAKTCRLDFGLLADWCRTFGMDAHKLQGIRSANTAREALSMVKGEPREKDIYRHILGEALRHARSFSGEGARLVFYLFDLDGTLLEELASE